MIETYKDYHRKVWPEVEAGTSRAGITRMKIFLLGRHLFMYMETTDDFDLVGHVEQYMKYPRVAEWENLMESYQERVAEAKPGELWANMELVYESH